MANILDLLTDWKNVTTRNPEISVIYVFYQVFSILQAKFADSKAGKFILK